MIIGRRHAHNKGFVQQFNLQKYISKWFDKFLQNFDNILS